MRQYLLLAERAVRAGPRAVARRMVRELASETERFRAPIRARQLNGSALLRATDARSLDALWLRLLSQPYPAVTRADSATTVVLTHPEERSRILSAAELALARVVDLLGSGPVALTDDI